MAPWLLSCVPLTNPPGVGLLSKWVSEPLVGVWGDMDDLPVPATVPECRTPPSLWLGGISVALGTKSHRAGDTDLVLWLPLF